MKIYKWISIPVMLLVLTVLTGCAATAYIEKAEGVNMTDYRSYAWANSSEKKQEASAKHFSLVEQKLQKSIDRELKKSGWDRSVEHPDVLISFDVLVEKGIKEQVEPVYSQSAVRYVYNPRSKRWVPVVFPPRYLGDSRYNVNVKEVTLTLTMVDAKTEQVIWQGWTTSEVNNKNLTQKEVDKIISTIFRKADLTKR